MLTFFPGPLVNVCLVKVIFYIYKYLANVNVDPMEKREVYINKNTLFEID